MITATGDLTKRPLPEENPSHVASDYTRSSDRILSARCNVSLSLSRPRPGVFTSATRFSGNFTNALLTSRKQRWRFPPRSHGRDSRDPAICISANRELAPSSASWPTDRPSAYVISNGIRARGDVRAIARFLFAPLDPAINHSGARRSLVLVVSQPFVRNLFAATGAATVTHG